MWILQEYIQPQKVPKKDLSVKLLMLWPVTYSKHNTPPPPHNLTTHSARTSQHCIPHTYTPTPTHSQLPAILDPILCPNFVLFSAAHYFSWWKVIFLFRFLQFDLEESDNCNRDYVEVHRESAEGTLLGHFCGNSVPTNLTVADKLWIKFNSDATNTAGGFMAQYNLRKKKTYFYNLVRKTHLEELYVTFCQPKGPSINITDEPWVGFKLWFIWTLSEDS